MDSTARDVHIESNPEAQSMQIPVVMAYLHGVHVNTTLEC